MGSKIISIVTGASGFVGSTLVDYLISKGHHVRTILRSTSSHQWLENKPIEIINCGLLDKEQLKNILKDADYLFHVAGVVKSKTEEGYMEGNVETTRSLLDALSEIKSNIKKVVITSSLTVCGPSLDGEPCTEKTLEHPITRYGRSKFFQEQLAKSYMDKLPITIVRAPAVYGPRDTEIFLVLKTYKHGLMTLVGFNEKRISLVYVDDLVEGQYLAAISPNSSGQTYFIASAEQFNWLQIRDAISKAMNKKALTLRIPHSIVYIVALIAEFFALFNSKAATFNIEKARDFVQQYWTCDISKSIDEIGFVPKVSLEEGMKRTVEWYRKMKWL